MKMKKKNVFAAAAAVLCFSLPLAGCESSEGKLQLGQYMGIEVSTPAQATAEEVDEAIQGVLAYQSVTEEVIGRPVQMGDVVNIDYEGLKDGVAFEGGTDQGFDLEIGSGMFIPGFEDGLIGAEAGETRALDLTFPEDYTSNELAGQAVVFNVTVHSIKKKVTPELTDELVASISEYKTVEEFRAFAQETLDLQHQNIRKQEVWNSIMDSSTIEEYSKKDIEIAVADMKKVYTAQAEKQDMTLEEYLASNSVEQAKFEEDLQKSAKEMVAQQMIAKAIAKAEGLEVTDEDYARDIDGYLSITGMGTVADMEAAYGRDMLRLNLLQDKVLDYVSDAAVYNAAAGTNQ